MTIYNCGYYPAYMRNSNKKFNDIGRKNLKSLIMNLTSFKCNEIYSSSNDISLKIKEDDLKPNLSKLLSIYDNIISRGMPTYPSLFVENNLANYLNLDIPLEIKDKVSYDFNFAKMDENNEKIWNESLIQAHMLIDPEISNKKVPDNIFDSNEEKIFYKDLLPKYFGEDIYNFIDIQKSFQYLIDNDSANDFMHQRVDFTFEFFNLKYVIEIDGEQHSDEDQQKLDNKRDEILADNGWSVIRISADDVNKDNIKKDIVVLRNKLANSQLYKYYKSYIQKPLWENDIGSKALNATLTPFLIARIQKLLIKLLSNNNISIDKDKWYFAFFERDIPGVELAIEDFIKFFNQLKDLMDLEIKLPDIELLIIYNNKFYNDQKSLKDLNLESKVTYITENEIDSTDFSADLFIDVSILKKDYYKVNYSLINNVIAQNGTAYSLRSNYSYIENRKINSNKPIKYSITNNKKDNLNYFLKNIFRKEKFREGQFEIVQRALNLESVIGLLPTGGGKSLAYQMAGLLQPGITLVVQPIRSLMFDQYQNLLDMGIDNVQYINSDLNDSEKEKAINDLSQGRTQIVLISPERLQIQDFRERLKQLTANIPITYFVIDEAHCVSEWGHDFRTSYLHLDKVAVNYCEYADYVPPYIALTGTASFAVLTDVQRELNIQDGDARIVPKTFDRTELHYEIHKVDSNFKGKRLKGILDNLPDKFGLNKDEFYQCKNGSTFSGLIFAPHVNGDFGVYRICNKVRNYLGVPVSYYSGSIPKKANFSRREFREYDQYKQEIQVTYKNNQIPLLVCTKAFGMGIDKPNIRYTIHYGIPQSLEAFYQEAGRAGRDGNDAICILIFSDDSSEHADVLMDPKKSAEEISNIKELPWGARGDAHRLMWFHKNSFQGEQKEFKMLKSLLLEKVIKPEFKSMQLGEKRKISVSYNNKNKNDYETGLHRLSIIGLVKDYTVDYSSKQFSVEIVKRDYEIYLENLIKYLSLYKTREYTSQIKDKINDIIGENKLVKSLRFLINFIYEEIEKKRRNAIKTMVEVARESEKGEEIRDALIAYLEKSPYTEALEEIAKSINSEEWWKLIEKINDIDSARSLLFGARRRLESSPDHPGFYFLSAFARLLLDNSKYDNFISDIKLGIDNLFINLVEKEMVITIIEELLIIFDKKFRALENYKEIKKELANTIIIKSENRKLARDLYDLAPEISNKVLLKLSLIRLSKIKSKLLGGF